MHSRHYYIHSSFAVHTLTEIRPLYNLQYKFFTAQHTHWPRHVHCVQNTFAAMLLLLYWPQTRGTECVEQKFFQGILGLAEPARLWDFPEAQNWKQDWERSGFIQKNHTEYMWQQCWSKTFQPVKSSTKDTTNKHGMRTRLSIYFSRFRKHFELSI